MTKFIIKKKKFTTTILQECHKKNKKQRVDTKDWPACSVQSDQDLPSVNATI